MKIKIFLLLLILGLSIVSAKLTNKHNKQDQQDTRSEVDRSIEEEEESPFKLLQEKLPKFQKPEAEPIEQLFKQFNEWKDRYNKVYHSTEEEFYRFKIWMDTKQHVDHHNFYIFDTLETSHTLETNQYADFTEEEFGARYLMDVKDHDLKELQNMPVDEDLEANPQHLLTTNDWVAKGKTPPVKNQGNCGSCWAFAALAHLNSNMKIKKNILTNYSEQQLVSCTTYLGNAGCGGGWSDKALNYVKAKGICSSAEYPYVSGQTRLTGSCNTVKQTACTLKGPKIASVVNSGYGSCTNLVLAIDKHPVVVYVYASQWYLYSSGVFNQCTNTQINHAVAAVGYYQNKWWRLLNSWGAGWGSSGYIYIPFGNTCNVCQYGGIYANLS